MSGVNKAILVGNLGADPELRYTQGGTAVAELRLATSRKWKDQSGASKEDTQWHRVVVWGKQAESCKEYLAKGRQVYVEGRLQTREWKDCEGNKRWTTEIVAEQVVFLGGRSGSASAREDGPPPAEDPATASSLCRPTRRTCPSRRWCRALGHPDGFRCAVRGGVLRGCDRGLAQRDAPAPSAGAATGGRHQAHPPREEGAAVMLRLRLGARPSRRKAKRREADFYPTPPEAIATLLEQRPPPTWRVLEPAAGDGAIVRALLERGYEASAVELRYECLPILGRLCPTTIGDWIEIAKSPDAVALAAGGQVQSIVTNVPFAIGPGFSEACLSVGAAYVALLLKLDAEGSPTWKEFWGQHPWDDRVKLWKRPSFTGDGKTDGHNYAWFVWDHSKEKRT